MTIRQAVASRAKVLCTIALSLLALAPLSAAHAQSLFLTSGSYTASDATYTDGSILAGYDPNFATDDGMGNPYVATINYVTGGSVRVTLAANSSTINISGGNVRNTFAANTSTVNISGGTVGLVEGENSSTINISGGSVRETRIFNTSTANISGGTLTDGLSLGSAGATANFIGTGLSFAYQSYGYSNPINTFADFFRISGTIGGVPTTYDLFVANDDGFGGAATPNEAPRQFLFNGAVPVVVPEAGTMGLLLAGGAAFGGFVTKRKR